MDNLSDGIRFRTGYRQPRVYSDMGEEVYKVSKTPRRRTLAEVIAARARELGIDLRDIGSQLEEPVRELELEPEALGLPLSTVCDFLAALGIDPSEITIWADAKAELRPPTYASVIRAHRRRLKLTQAELAEKIGIPTNSLTQLETGRRTPSLPMARRIAVAFGRDLTIFSDCE